MHSPIRPAPDLEGRLLAHVYDDTADAPQMILEGTDASVHFILHTPSMEQMRQEGGLKPNSFVLMERVGLSEADLLLKIEDHAHSEAYLSSAAMQKSANRVIQRGVIAPNAEYGGWLENYHRASPPQEGLTNVPSTMHLARPKLNRGRHLNTLRLGGTIVNF